jgi:hypothetical protein
MSIPVSIAQTHRGVEIHTWQSPHRVWKVRHEIDRDYSLNSVAELVAYVENSANPPEARLFAAAKVTALHEQAAESRERGPTSTGRSPRRPAWVASSGSTRTGSLHCATWAARAPCRANRRSPRPRSRRCLRRRTSQASILRALILI